MRRKCYIYMRVSTAIQVDGFSLDAQKQRMQEYADYKDLDIVGEYCDAGRSGKNITGRPEFQRMIEDVTSGIDGISFVLVFKLSRFGRNAADILKSIQLLEDYDVSLVSVEERIDSSNASGRLVLSLLSAVAEMEKDNIRDQFMAGHLQKVMEGGWYGGVVPFGYRSVNKELVPEPKEAELVRRIFTEYLTEGASVCSVIGKLNREGYVRTSKGTDRPLTIEFVRNVLDNPIYCGRLAYKREKRITNSDGSERILTNDNPIVVRGKHPAFVSEADWEEACAKRNQNNYRPQSDDPTRVSLLSGLLRCPVCGRGLSAKNIKKKNTYHGGYYKTRHYYQCQYSQNAHGRECTCSRHFNQEKIDAAVFEIVNRLVCMEQFRGGLEKCLGKDRDEDALKRRLHELQGQKDEFLEKQRKYEDSLDSLDVFDENYDAEYGKIQRKLDETYDSIDAVEKKMCTVKERISAVRQSSFAYEQIVSLLSNFSGIYEKMTRQEKRDYYRSFIDRIDLFEEEQDGRVIKRITFKFPLAMSDSQGIPGNHRGRDFTFTLDCTGIRKTAAESKATYSEIQKYILEKSGQKVSGLNIAQMKKKYGIETRKCFNKGKPGGKKQQGCTPEKEKLIVDAFRHFLMIDESSDDGRSVG